MPVGPEERLCERTWLPKTAYSSPRTYADAILHSFSRSGAPFASDPFIPRNSDCATSNNPFESPREKTRMRMRATRARAGRPGFTVGAVEVGLGGVTRATRAFVRFACSAKSVACVEERVGQRIRLDEAVALARGQGGPPLVQ